jgi:hypothetical protein
MVVAKLPFTPIGVVAHITHSQLDGEDMRMCSVAFLYLLTLFSLRNIIKKALG